MTATVQTVVVVSSTPYVGHQLYDQRLARAILKLKRGVVYVEPAVPLLVRGRWHDAPRKLRWTADDGVEVISPRMLPLGRRALLAPFTAVMMALQVRVLLGRRPGHSIGVIVTAGHPLLTKLFARFPRVLLVKDDYAAGSSLTGLNPRVVRRRRRALLRQFTDVAAVSPTLAETLLREGARARVVPAGCDLVAGEGPEPEALRHAQRPRAVFTGMLSDRIDFGMLETVLTAGCTLIFAGRRQMRFSEQATFDRLVSTGGVLELGELDARSLEAVTTHCDIGLVPYTLTNFNLASFPLKTFEYLAAGLPVLSSALPSVVWLEDPNITIIGELSLAEPLIRHAIDSASSAAVRAACRETASRNTWLDRAAVYLDMLDAQCA